MNKGPYDHLHVTSTGAYRDSPIKTLGWPETKPISYSDSAPMQSSTGDGD